MAEIVQINRPVFTLDEFNNKYEPAKARPKTIYQSMKQKCTLRFTAKLISSYVPIVKVVRKYRLKENIIGDVLSGLTVSFIHLPQALAFGLLASLQPVYGLYTTFFPVLFYMIFGTSPYVSFGPTANMAILARSVIEREANLFIANYESMGNSSANFTNIIPSEGEILQVKVGAAISCSVLSGVFLATLGIFRLGFLTSYLSSSFIGGFTTATAVFVASSQVPKLFGIGSKSYSGAGGLVLSYIDLFRNIRETKLVEVLISVICIAILLLVKVCINERYKERIKFPVPIDFILAVIATVISYFANLEDNYNVVIVGPIPSGFAAPSMPKLANASNFISDAIVIAIVSLMMSITFAKLTAKKHGNQIDESQELFSYGISNILAGLFGCFPAANASPRTMILSSLGAKTTLNGLVTVIVFLLIILVVGQLFIYLPTAVLASMIIISTKDLILQYRNLPNIWRINKYDFIIWTVTNVSAVFLDLYYGLICGIVISIIMIVIQNQMESGYLIDVDQTENVLFRVDNHLSSNTPIKMFRFPINLYFATVDRFKSNIHETVFNPRMYVKTQKKLQKTKCIVTNISINRAFEDVEDTKSVHIDRTNDIEATYKPDCVIIDCSMMSYIDMAGINMIQEITQEFSKFDITIYLTGIPKSTMNKLTTAGFFKTFSRSHVFLDVVDALAVAKSRSSCVTHL